MTRTQALVIECARCNDASRAQEWSDWYDEVHLPDRVGRGGAWVATRWQVAGRPEPGRPGLGFTHVAIYELEGASPDAAPGRLRARQRELDRLGRLHPSHCVIGVDVVRAHGSFREKPAPSQALRGQILAWVLCSQPRREREWDAWYDAVHAPDMLATGAFSALTRWVRRPRTAFGAQHLTLYDVSLDSVAQAVERSAAAMPALHAGGRWLDCHAGALALALEPCGRFAGAGLRA